MPAPLTREVPSILVSELYTKGSPRPGVQVTRTFETTSHWRLRARVTPLDDDVVARIDRLLLVDYSGPVLERWARVEWQPWRFGSRRAWVLCSLCGARCLRFYLYRGATLFGSIACGGCASVRYRSQDASPADRLVLKIDSLRSRLGGPPTRGQLGIPWPARPETMQFRIYVSWLEKLDRLEARLADELGVPFPLAADDTARQVLGWERRGQATADELGE